MRVGMGLTRDQEIDYANERGIEIPITKASPYSIDVNLWGRSCETGVLEDPWVTPPPDAYEWTVAPADAPDAGRDRRSSSRAASRSRSTASGSPPVELVERLHELGGAHGVGRIDHVEDRLVGIKSREIYEAPAATILHAAHRALEGLTLSRDTLRFNRFVADELARLIYDGLWFSALSRDLRAYVASSQRVVSGEVRVRLDHGQAIVVGRRSPLLALRQEPRHVRRGRRASTTRRPSGSSRSSGCRCGSRRRATARSASATAPRGRGPTRSSTTCRRRSPTRSRPRSDPGRSADAAAEPSPVATEPPTRGAIPCTG